MTTNDDEAPPVRGMQHKALSVFVGKWRAEGQAFGGPKQDAQNPRSAADAWHSTHTGTWHTGGFFLIQDERALIGVDHMQFDTISIMGVDAKTGRYFARSFENHGFARAYDVARDGRVWTFTGHSERATVTFSPDDRTQTIVWEWRPGDDWLPLCDRVATRVDA